MIRRSMPPNPRSAGRAATRTARDAVSTPEFPRFRRLGVVLGLALLLAPFTVPAQSLYEIEIKKSERLLILRAGGEVKRIFHIALGRGGPGAKQHLGDNKTPEGTYRIVGFNDRSRFDMFLRLNYPNVKDAFYGFKKAVITRDELERIVRALRHNEVPPQNTALGGAIGIHGIGEETPEKIQIHDNLDWTEGCIALRNADLHDLRSFVDIGTRVVIRE
jgi:murein L,D-transpeptidase YafK